MRPLAEIQKDVRLIQIWMTQAHGPWGEEAARHSKATNDLQWDIIDIITPLKALVKAAEATTGTMHSKYQWPIPYRIYEALEELNLALKPFQQDAT